MQPKIIQGGLAVDDRGQLTFVNEFDFKDVKRFYMVENHRRGFIRAWHGHEKEAKYVFVAQGSILIGVVPLNAPTYPNQTPCEELKKFILSSHKPQILYIPSGNYNGFVTLEENTKVIFFSTTTLEESLGDDIRRGAFAWNIWEEDFR